VPNDPNGPSVHQSAVIYGRRDEIDGIQREILSAMGTSGWDQESQFALRLVIEEALVNAHVHGHHRDESKSITVRWVVGQDDIWLQVEDSGGGFDPDCVPDPTHNYNLEIPSGRGLVLMRAYMDEVSHNFAGNQVTMIRRRHRGGRTPAVQESTPS